MRILWSAEIHRIRDCHSIFSPHKSSCRDTKKTPWTVCVCVCTRVRAKNVKWQHILSESSLECPTMLGEKGGGSCGDKLCFPLWEEHRRQLHWKRAGLQASWRDPAQEFLLAEPNPPRRLEGHCLGWSWTGEPVCKVSWTIPCLFQGRIQWWIPKVEASCPTEKMHAEIFCNGRFLRAQVEKNILCIFILILTSLLWSWESHKQRKGN